MSEYEQLIRFDALAETLGAVDAGVNAVEQAKAQANAKIAEMQDLIVNGAQSLQEALATVGSALTGVTAQEATVADGGLTVTGLQLGQGGPVVAGATAFVDEDGVPITAYVFRGIA